MPNRDRRASRVIRAVMENLLSWEQRSLSIADECPVGCKHQALALARDIEAARHSLKRLTQEVQEADD